MNANLARELTKQFLGDQAASNFDPLWPETLLGLGEFEQTPIILAALVERLDRLAGFPLSVERARYEQLLKSVASQMIDGPGALWAGRHDGLLAAYRAAHAPQKQGASPAQGDDAPIALLLEQSSGEPRQLHTAGGRELNHYQSMRRALANRRALSGAGVKAAQASKGAPSDGGDAAAQEQLHRFGLMAQNLLAREGASGATLGKIDAIGQQLGLDAMVAKQIVDGILQGQAPDAGRSSPAPFAKALTAQSSSTRRATRGTAGASRSVLDSTFEPAASGTKWKHLAGVAGAAGVLVLGLAGIGWVLVTQIKSTPAPIKPAANAGGGAAGTTASGPTAPLVAGVPAGADGGSDASLAVPLSTATSTATASGTTEDANRFVAGSATDARSVLTALTRLNQQLSLGDLPEAAKIVEATATGQQAMTMLLEGWPTLDPQLRTALAEGLVQHALVMRRYPTSGATQQLAARVEAQTARLNQPAVDLVDLMRTIGAGGVAVRLLREPELPEELRKAAGAFVRNSKLVSPQAATYGDGLLAAVPAAWERVYIELINPKSTTTPAQCGERCRDFVGLARRASGVVTARSVGSGDASRMLQLQIIDAIDSVLEMPGDQADGGASPAWDQRRLSVQRSALEALGSALLFRPNDPARRSLLTWLASERVPSLGLHLLTSTLASTSTSAGFDATTVLPASAAMPDREALRSQLAERWQTPLNVSGADDASRWAISVQRVQAKLGDAKSDLERLQVAAFAAELHRAAWQLHQRLSGQSGEDASGAMGWFFPQPDAIVFDAKLMTGPSFALPGGSIKLPAQGLPGDVGAGSGGGDGLWALRYLTDSRTVGLKVAALSDIRTQGPRGPIDAEVLMEAALTTSGEVRIAAQDAALAHRENPTILQAALDIVPRVPRSMRTQRFLALLTESMSDMQPLTSTDPAWLAYWRKTLIEKLVERAALASSIGSADVLAARIAMSYGVMLGHSAPQTLTSTERQALGVDKASTSDGGAIPAGASPFGDGELASPAMLASTTAMRAGILARQTRQALAGVSRRPIIALATLEQRAASRGASAIGGPQAFVAEQMTLAESLGVLVASERPGQERRVEEILAGLDEALTKAGTVTEQIARSEIAIVELWAIRLGVGL
jgi:hypothetical protein